MMDREILYLLFQRDEQALTVIAEQFGHRLQRLAENILQNDRDAQECVNDTYLALWNSIPPLQPEPLLPYAQRVCKNIAISRLRTRTAGKRSGYETALDELAEVIGNGSAEEVWQAKEMGRAIDTFLDTLPKENRVIFLRRYWYGDSVGEISIRMRLSENTVSVRLNRIRSKLKRYLTQEGLL